jgi:hypothetical protein
MTQPQILELFTQAAADPRFPAALGVAALAGLVRGFSGFGSALIYMPLVSAVYGPHVAAATLLLIDSICSLPFAIQAMPQCNWREVTPVTIAGAVALPFGAAMLVYLDPLLLRWFIAVLVLVALATLAAGWRYHGKPTIAASLGVGALAGFGGGAAQIGAPPLLVYWLGGKNKSTRPSSCSPARPTPRNWRRRSGRRHARSEQVDQLQQLLAGLVVDRHGVLRLPGQLRLAGFAEFRLQRLGDVAVSSCEA